MKVERLFVEDIEVGNRLRHMHEAAIVALAESMQRLGQLNPISVYRPNEKRLLLVTGLHRVEAAKRLGWEEIDAVLVTGNEIERELQEIAENLHRSELTALERDTQIGRWAELTAARASQVETPLGGVQPSEKGVRKVANDLGLDKSRVQRALKIASISPEAKQAARDAGLDDNRTALLAVAKAATPAAQLAKIVAISSVKIATKAKNQAVANVPLEPKALKKSGEVADTHLISALNQFAEFCGANSPGWVAADVLPGEVAEVRVRIADIREWLGQFVTALDRVEAAEIATAAERPRHPDIVPPAKHEPVAAESDLCRYPDLPAFLDRRGKVADDVSKPSMEVPVLQKRERTHFAQQKSEGP
jgi:ParB-like chromosome segregation protein Spo0J